MSEICSAHQGECPGERSLQSRLSASEERVRELESKLKRLISVVKMAMDERILNHPNVEASAMEDLEVVMAQLTGDGGK